VCESPAERPRGKETPKVQLLNYSSKTMTKTEYVQRHGRVWDLPTRVFHWALAATVSGLAITGTLGGSAMVWHFRFGYTVLALLMFRLVWGLVGGHWSRFASFLYAPRRVVDYLAGRDQAHLSVGHSPMGALSVIAMLAFLFAQAATGLMSDDEISFAGPLTAHVSGAWVSLATYYHTSIGKWIVLGLVALHLLAIAYYSFRKHQLVSSMLHGDKALPAGLPVTRDDAASRLLAFVVLAVSGGVVYWVSTLGAPAF
jgi:cytochrome b